MFEAERSRHSTDALQWVALAQRKMGEAIVALKEVQGRLEAVQQRHGDVEMVPEAATNQSA